MNNPNSQEVENLGPIPEGYYNIDNTQWSHLNTGQQLWRLIRGGDWGEYNVPLAPISYQGIRSGFYLHGGYYPGSAGCIDVGQNIGNIYNYINTQSITTLRVRY